MKRINHKILAFITFCALALHTSAQPKKAGQPQEVKTLIVFFDGLRPDYITQELMPNLYAFKQKACYGTQHHSVFPTVTRVNASSYSTGSYPGTHGLMGNTVFFPQVKTNGGLNTGDAADLNKIDSATDGHLLTTISLGEVLKNNGKKMMVFSSGSTGQALMQNHTASGGPTINPGMILPESFRQQVINDIGPIPAGGKPNTAQHKWVTDALLKYGLQPDGPLVSAIWLSDPDGAAHSDGIGSPKAIEALKAVDTEFGRIIDALKARNLDGLFNIIISTDHGFITHAGKQGLTEFLIAEGFKKDKDSEDVIVVEGAIYVKDHDEAIIQKIVSALQAQTWVGGIFTKGKAGDTKGHVPGTVSFEAIHWNHPQRAADILTDANWDDTKNAYGYAGTNYARGVAGHGGLSPYEVHIGLMVYGPSFKKGGTTDLPTSNVDIVPTILAINHIPVPTAMDGRVIEEVLTSPSSSIQSKWKPSIHTIETIATYNGGSYQLQLQQTVFGKYVYVDFSKVTRKN